MTIEERLEFAREKFKEVEALLIHKGRDYAKECDANENFSYVANDLNDHVTKYDVWYVFFTKHLRALQSYVRNARVESEPIGGRLVDLITYLFIVWSMIETDQRNIVADEILSELREEEKKKKEFRDQLPKKDLTPITLSGGIS